MIRMQDEKAWFTQAALQQQNSLYLLAFSILKNDEDAKDAVQDALIQAYRNLDSLRDKSKFRPWIMKILTNCAYAALRKKAPAEQIETQWDLAAPEERIDISTKLSLWEAVQLLPLPYRTVVTLYYYENLSVKEIGKITDSRPDAVKKRLSRAREQLKQILPKEVLES